MIGLAINRLVVFLVVVVASSPSLLVRGECDDCSCYDNQRTDYMKNTCSNGNGGKDENEFPGDCSSGSTLKCNNWNFVTSGNACDNWISQATSDEDKFCQKECCKQNKFYGDDECCEDGGGCPNKDFSLCDSYPRNPFKCGDDYSCVYPNRCLAEKNGFDIDTDCCQSSTPGACTSDLRPVVCGSKDCPYDNLCLAMRAGYQEWQCTPKDGSESCRCDDKPTPYMTDNNMDCGVIKTNKFWRENRCNNANNEYLTYWNREKFCGLTCYEIGQGYDDYPYSDCCNGVSEDDNACNLDTKQCCNGDVVGRTGQLCKFDCPPDTKKCPKPDGSGYYTIKANESTCNFPDCQRCNDDFLVCSNGQKIYRKESLDCKFPQCPACNKQKKQCWDGSYTWPNSKCR
mmetsp:Transcript_16731/g.36324  ORF Transcript_16731/g.36324 Transcript_16731/m.36324 type:complete len:399 (-) Transcript_16731:90-1286(-)